MHDVSVHPSILCLYRPWSKGRGVGEGCMEGVTRIPDMQLAFVVAGFYGFYLVKCNLTKLTTTILAVKRSTSLAVKWFISLAVKRFTSVAVKCFTSLAVKWSTSLAVHKLSSQAAHKRSGHPAVNPISAGSHGLW